MHVVPAGHPKHLQNQAEPHHIGDGFIHQTAWRLHQPTGDKLFRVFKSLLGFVPHAESKCFPAGAYHGEDDQGREEAHDNVAHQLHQLVPATERGSLEQGHREVEFYARHFHSRATGKGVAVPSQQVPYPRVWAGLGPGTWDCGETPGAFGFLFGATTWRKPLMAARPCSASLLRVPGPTHPPTGAGRWHSPLMEEENVDGPDRRHDPDDPAHVGGPGTQLPQVQLARPRSVVRRV